MDGGASTQLRSAPNNLPNCRCHRGSFGSRPAKIEIARSVERPLWSGDNVSCGPKAEARRPLFNICFAAEAGIHRNMLNGRFGPSAVIHIGLLSGNALMFAVGGGARLARRCLPDSRVVQGGGRRLRRTGRCGEQRLRVWVLGSSNCETVTAFEQVCLNSLAGRVWCRLE